MNKHITKTPKRKRHVITSFDELKAIINAGTVKGTDRTTDSRVNKVV